MQRNVKVVSHLSADMDVGLWRKEFPYFGTVNSSHGINEFVGSLSQQVQQQGLVSCKIRRCGRDHGSPARATASQYHDDNRSS